MLINTDLSYQSKISRNRNIQLFFRNKVFIGLKDEPLKRKVYRGKRNAEGKRNNEVYYVNDNQDFRISEEMLIKYINIILEALKDMDEKDISLTMKTTESKRQLFEIRQKHFLKEEHTAEEYKKFISSMLNEDDNQHYLNLLVNRKIKERDFKDIIEKIEIYETGLICILNNGFEMSVTF